MRDSSHAITRSTLQRSVISMPNSRSAPSANATLLPGRVEIVLAIGPGDDLVVLAVLADLLEAAVQVADVRDAAHDRLAVELEHEAQHAVRRRMLRPDVDEHVLALELRLQRRRRLDGDDVAAVVRRRAGRAADGPAHRVRSWRARLRPCVSWSPCYSPVRLAGAEAAPHVGGQILERLGDRELFHASSAPRDSRRAPGAAARSG